MYSLLARRTDEAAMKAVRSTVTLTALLCAIQCSAADSTDPANPTPSPAQAQRAYESLRSVNLFSIGGTGIAGDISEGELAYRTLLASPNGLDLFRHALATGSNEAKLYALCGIRRLDQRAFDSASKALVTANPNVATMVGCMINEEDKAATVIKRMVDGSYGCTASGGR